MELDDQIVGSSGNNELILSSASIGYLTTIRKWTMFFSILGFVFVLLMFGMGFIVQALAGFNPAINAIPIGGLIVVYIIFGLIYVPPIISLFKFSKN